MNSYLDKQTGKHIVFNILLLTMIGVLNNPSKTMSLAKFLLNFTGLIVSFFGASYISQS